MLPDQADNYDITVPISVIPISGSFSHNASSVSTFNTLNNAEIETIVFHSGRFKMNLNSSFAGGIQNVIEISSLVKNGNSFIDTISQTQSIDLDLSGYTLDLTRGSQGFNELLFNNQLVVTASAGTSVPNPAATISYSLEGLEFEEVTGDFKQQVVGIDSDSIQLKLFGNLADVGALTFTNPTITLLANNSLGFPIRIDLSDIYTYNIISGDTFKLITDASASQFDIAYPLISAKGDSVTSTLIINKDNSTIVRVVSPTPKYLVTAVSSSSNPTGAPAQNYITRDGFLKLETELELPLEGNIQNYAVRDTFPYEFTENIEEIDSILIRSNITNGFPVDAWIQVYLTDANYNILDSLFPSIDENIVSSGEVNSLGRVDKPISKITDVTYSQSRVANLTQAKHTILAGRLKSANDGKENVKIYDEYQISLKIGMMAFGAVKLGEGE